MSALASAAVGLAVGDPTSEDTDMGPLISAAQRDRVSGFVDAGAGGRRGASPAARRSTGPGHFYAPTVVAGLRRATRSSSARSSVPS